MAFIPNPRSEKTGRLVIDRLDRGWSTRTFPHLLDPRQLYVADNVVFNRDGLVSKRPGNAYYGTSVAGATGSGQPIAAMTRYYPVGGSPQLVVHSGSGLYKGNDTTGAFTLIGATLSPTSRATFAQAYDPDMTTGPAAALFVCDGVHVPRLYDGVNFVPVQTGTYAASGGASAGNWLPVGNTGQPITPAYVLNWREHLVYAGDPTEPTGIYISDALEPERFNGYSLVTSSATPYTPYFPAGRDGTLGVITGLATVGPYLVIFYTSGIAVGINTGTYGAFNYEFSVISTATGCPSPRSIAAFEGYIIFFGGDRFYATDGNTIQIIPDEIPSVYGTGSQSAFPSEMFGKNTVVGVRRGGQYWAGYDNVGNGQVTSVAVFDTQAGGGYTFGAPSGGAWSRWPSGMNVNCGIECRGPGDNFQMFWGSSIADLVAQHDVGAYSDFGLAIAVQIRAKAFTLDKFVWPKLVQGLHIVGAFPIAPTLAAPGQYSDSVIGYVVLDATQSIAPVADIQVSQMGVKYGTNVLYGNAQYSSGGQIVTQFAKTYPQQPARGTVIQPGVIEISTNPFNLLAFVVELTIDEPN